MPAKMQMPGQKQAKVSAQTVICYALLAATCMTNWP